MANSASLRPPIRQLAARYRQHGHDLDGIARKDRKVRVILKEFGGGLVRVATHNHKSAHIVADVVDVGMLSEGQALTMAEAGFRHAG